MFTSDNLALKFLAMDNFFQFYNIEPDANRSDWVVERCCGPKHTLHTFLPSGFASNVRICHPGWYVDPLPPEDEEAWSALRAGWIDSKALTAVRWHDVALANNHTPHRLMQWFQTCSSAIREPGMAGLDSPLEGDLTKEMVESLFEVLADHSGANQEVLCGFWEGFNRSDYRASASFESYRGQQHYLLFHSTLSQVRDAWLAAFEHVSSRHGIGTAGLAPNAVWPTTCDWYLAVPYNLRSSYLGGPVDLVSRIFSAANLETYKALPGDNILVDGAN